MRLAFLAGLRSDPKYLSSAALNTARAAASTGGGSQGTPSAIFPADFSSWL